MALDETGQLLRRYSLTTVVLGFQEVVVTLSLQLATCVASCCLGQAAPAERTVAPVPPVRKEIVVPLRDGKWLHVRDFAAAANKSLDLVIPTEWIDGGKRIEIDAATKWTVLGLELSGVLEPGAIEFRDKSVVFRVPTEREGRRRVRQLAKMLGMPIPDWPPNKRGIVVPEPFDPDLPTVLFVHGLGASCDATFARLKSHCAESGIQTLFFDYPNIGPLDVSAKRLRSELAALERKHPKLKLAIVAHSMGGLVVRDALERPGEPLRGGDVFLIGTPQAGSHVAEMYPAVWTIERSLAPLDWKSILDEGLGEAAIDLAPGSDFLLQLARHPVPKAVRYHVLLGSRAFLAEAERKAVLAPIVKIAAAEMTAELKARVLRTLSEMDEIVTGLGDGCVTLKSGQVRSAASTRTFDLNHLDLCRSDDVWNHIAATLRWNRKQDPSK